jgi:hypothetical protein
MSTNLRQRLRSLTAKAELQHLEDRKAEAALRKEEEAIIDRTLTSFLECTMPKLMSDLEDRAKAGRDWVMVILYPDGGLGTTRTPDDILTPYPPKYLLEYTDKLVERLRSMGLTIEARLSPWVLPVSW